MADLSVDADSRAQLLIVGAFGVAVFLLVLAGVLNTVTYTESLATRNDDIGHGRDIAAVEAATRAAVGGITARRNEQAAPLSAKTARIERSVANWSDVAGQGQAVDVTAVNVRVLNTTGVVNVTQTTGRNYTNATGDPRWTLVENVTGVRQFNQTIDRASLATGDCLAGAPCYTLRATNGSAAWTVQVNNSAVVVDTPTTNTTCTVSTDPVRLNLTAGTVNGAPCAGLNVTTALAGTYAISYRNGNNAIGSYRLRVEGASVYTNYAASGDPSVETTVETVTVRLVYQTPEVFYRTELQVREGDTDD